MFKRSKDKEKDKKRKESASNSPATTRDVSAKENIAIPSNAHSSHKDVSKSGKSPTPSQKSAAKSSKRQAPAPPGRKSEQKDRDKETITGSSSSVNYAMRSPPGHTHGREVSNLHDESNRKHEQAAESGIKSSTNSVDTHTQKTATPPPTRSVPIPASKESSLNTNSTHSLTKSKTPPKIIPYNATAKRQASNLTKKDSADVQLRAEKLTEVSGQENTPSEPADPPLRRASTYASLSKEAEAEMKLNNLVQRKLDKVTRNFADLSAKKEALKQENETLKQQVADTRN